jgi:hypothetical protein
MGPRRGCSGHSDVTLKEIINWAHLAISILIVMTEADWPKFKHLWCHRQTILFCWRNSFILMTLNIIPKYIAVAWTSSWTLDNVFYSLFDSCNLISLCISGLPYESYLFWLTVIFFFQLSKQFRDLDLSHCQIGLCVSLNYNQSVTLIFNLHHYPHSPGGDNLLFTEFGTAARGPCTRQVRPL